MWLILCMTLLFSAAQTAPADLSGAAQVELFDTDKQKVVQTFPNSHPFQQQAQRILDSVSGRVLELNPSLDHAMIAKIPLVPPKRLVHKPSRIDTEIAEMFVIMPKQGGRSPWLILKNKQYDTVVVEFTAPVDALRKQLRLSD